MIQTIRTFIAVGMMMLSGNTAFKSSQEISCMLDKGMAEQQEVAPFTLPYTQDEIRMVASVVMHEVGYCSRESKIAVTNVILNRLEDGRFGQNIFEVLHGKNQFAAINNYYTNRIPPDEACFQAVMAAMGGEDNSHGALYFCNPRYVNSNYARNWFSQLQLVFQIDGQNYYK